MNRRVRFEEQPGATRSAWPVRITVGLLVVALAAYFLFFFLTRDSQLQPPQLIDDVWTATVDGKVRVYYVTKEDRAEVRSFDVDGAYTYDHSYSLYTLQARDADGGAALATALLARIETTSADAKKYSAYRIPANGPGILGPAAELLWLWNNGLEARSLRTLEPVWTPEKLAAANPQQSALLPDDPKYTKVLAPLQALVFKGRNARFFQVDAGGKFQPVDEPQLAALSREHSKTADTAFSSLGADGRSLRAATEVGALCQRAWIDNGLWCGLLDSAERARLSPRLGFIEDWAYRNWLTSLGESVSGVFRGKYEVIPEPAFSKNAMQLDLGSVAAVGTQEFLSAGFLRRPGTSGCWTFRNSVPQGGDETVSALVLHREFLGEKSPWRLTLLGLDGAALWTRSTTLTDLFHLCDAGRTIVLTGFSNDTHLQKLRPDRIVFIDAATGESRILNVAGGELADGR
jgi:hypothetical protein